MLPYTHGGDVLTAQARYGGPLLDCSANLNPLGMPPQVGEAAARAAANAAPYPTPCVGSCARPSPPTTGWRRSRCSAAAGRRS